MKRAIARLQADLDTIKDLTHAAAADADHLDRLFSKLCVEASALPPCPENAEARRHARWLAYLVMELSNRLNNAARDIDHAFILLRELKETSDE
jgi:hypothetical protein